MIGTNHSSFNKTVSTMRYKVFTSLGEKEKERGGFNFFPERNLHAVTRLSLVRRGAAVHSKVSRVIVSFRIVLSQRSQRTHSSGYSRRTHWAYEVYFRECASFWKGLQWHTVMMLVLLQYPNHLSLSLFLWGEKVEIPYEKGPAIRKSEKEKENLTERGKRRRKRATG